MNVNLAGRPFGSHRGHRRLFEEKIYYGCYREGTLKEPKPFTIMVDQCRWRRPR